MSPENRDFYAKEVTDAIKKACDTLQVPQEELAIEVVETGSMGIFGLIRKKAHIRAVVKSLDLGNGCKKEKENQVLPESSHVEVKTEEIEKEKAAPSPDKNSKKSKPAKVKIMAASRLLMMNGNIGQGLLLGNRNAIMIEKLESDQGDHEHAHQGVVNAKSQMQFALGVAPANR